MLDVLLQLVSQSGSRNDLGRYLILCPNLEEVVNIYTIQIHCHNIKETDPPVR